MMHINEILTQCAEPGATFIDLTSGRVLGDVQLSEGLSASLVAASNKERPGLVVAIVDYQSGQSDLVETLKDRGHQTSYVVFLSSPEAVIESHLLETATQGGYEIVRLHRPQHPMFGVAAILERRDSAETRSLRTLGEFRITRFICRAQEEELARLRLDAENSEATRSQIEAVSQLQQDFDLNKEELSRLRRAYGRLLTERNELQLSAEEDSKRGAVHAVQLKAQLDRTYKRLEKSRSSVSFRLGRATTVALREARSDKRKLPSAWVSTFRGQDDVLEEVKQSGPSPAPPSNAAAAMRKVASENYLLGLPVLSGNGPIVATVASSAMAAQLSAATRCRVLTPGGWRHVLEYERPEYVLVCSDGLAQGTAWGNYGVFGGRGCAELVRSLSEFCAEQQLPIVFWDTEGTKRARLGLPLGAKFDAIFTVSPALLGRALPEDCPSPKLLEPAVEPRLYNPVGVHATFPLTTIFDGGFSQSPSRTERASREALMRAALEHNLRIFDPHFAEIGRRAAALGAVPGLAERTQHRPNAENLAKAYRRAGFVLCGQTSIGADFVSWKILAALMCGAHVLSTPLGHPDSVLAMILETATTQEQASECLRRRFQEARLAPWWQTAFAHLLERYSLRQRLDTISEALAVPKVATPGPRVAVTAHLSSAAEIGRFAYSLSRDRAPAEIHLLSEVAGARELLGNLSAAEIIVHGHSRAQHLLALSRSNATHFVGWEHAKANTKLVSRVTEVAMLSGSSFIALQDSPATQPYCFATPAIDSLLALSADLLRSTLASGASLLDWKRLGPAQFDSTPALVSSPISIGSPT